MAPLRPVQVAVDGSDNGWTALGWAVRVAQGAGAPLEVLYAVPRDLLAAVTGGAARPPEDEDGVTREALARVAKLAPELEVHANVLQGTPQNALLAQSRAASVLVMGTRGLTGLRGWWVGSVSKSLAEYALCPVVVCKTAQDDGGEEVPMPTGDVVVVVDPVVPSAGVLDFAYRSALFLRTGVRIVAAPSEARDLEHLLERQRARFPEVSVEVRQANGAAVDELIGESQRAGLVVVGRPSEMSLLGNTRAGIAATVLEQAQCPVAVVPLGRH